MGDRDGVKKDGKKTVNVGLLLDTFRKFAEAERREEETSSATATKRRDTNSTAGYSTLNWSAARSRNRTRGGSMSSLEEDSVIKCELLNKQGGRVKSWHNRFFVLRKSGGVAYYRDEEAYRNNEDPLGRILFHDMFDMSGNGMVSEILPISLYLLLGKRHVFVIHTEMRTYTIAAPSKLSAQEWTSVINESWEKFQLQFKKKNKLLGNIWKVGDEKVFDLAADLTKGATDVNQVVDTMMETIIDQFAAEVGRRYDQRRVWRCFYAWKALYRYVKSGGSGEDETENLNPTKSFFRLSKRQSFVGMFGVGKK